MRVVSTARDGRTHDRGQTPGSPDRRRDPRRRRQHARRRGLRRDLPRVARPQRGRAARSAARARRLPALQPPLRRRASAPVEEHAPPGGSRDHRAGGEQVRPGRRPRSGHLSARCRGGDTLFASMYAAYEALPPRLKARLDGRRGVFTYGGRRKATALLNPEDRDWTPVVHPIIRTHPETGRKALYFDPGKILAIEGLEADESDALIDELTDRMIQPEGEYRHRWRKGDVVIWDNRCSYHMAAGDYPPEEDRIHWRVSIKERT